MNYTPDIRRRSNRLAGFDYSQAGASFITITVRGRLPLFGDVANGEARLNDAGDMVRRVWEGMSERFPSITMDQFVVMPNHVHGITILRQPDGGEIGATTRAAHTVGGQDPGGNAPANPVGAPLVGAQRPDDGIRATTRVAPYSG